MSDLGQLNQILNEVESSLELLIGNVIDNLHSDYYRNISFDSKPLVELIREIVREEIQKEVRKYQDDGR
jgi:hypothetical protein